MIKKIFLLPVLLFTLFVSVNKVKADDTYNTLTDFYNTFDEQYNAMTTYSTEINNLISYWNNNLRDISSDYVLFYHDIRDSFTCPDPDICYGIFLFPLTSSNVSFPVGTGYGTSFDTIPLYDNVSYPELQVKVIYYGLYSNTYKYRLDNTAPNPSLGVGDILKRKSLFLTSSSPLVAIPFNNDDTIVYLPSYSSTDFNFPSYYISSYDYYPTVSSLVGGNFNPSPTANYLEVNVNNYDYIILSLKNYNQTSFRTELYVSGQLCLTPVYNYGMTEKKDIIVGSKNQECSTTYPSLTSVGMSISNNDINNHAVYYIKSPSNSLSNIVKFDTSVFDITYITSQNSSDPQVVINGRSYPVIPYDNLTDTAIISTNEGYISGQVCATGDINCQSQNMGMDINDLFTQPLRILQSVWGAISSVFIIITTFITILPPTLQVFLYTSFMLGVILGVLKILL